MGDGVVTITQHGEKAYRNKKWHIVKAAPKDSGAGMGGGAGRW